MEFKTINETFQKEEFEFLIKEKGEMTWREFILFLVKSRIEIIKISNKYAKEGEF